jgi:dinuclear metal center YbgI/SA1388 family protein
MTTVNDIEKALFDWAPLSLAMKDDKNGLQAGERYKPVRRVLLSLDVTQDTIDEAVTTRADLIVSHHPVLFGIDRPTDDTDAGSILLKLCRTGIASIAMHTNLDATAGGVNDKLAALAGLKLVRVFGVQPSISDGLGRLGQLPEPVPIKTFAELCQKVLNAACVRFYDAGKPVSLVAVCGGSGGSVLECAIRAGCDTLLTGELKHSLRLTSRNQGINVVECGHFATENIIMSNIAEYLANRFPEVEMLLSENSKEPYQCL